MTDLQQLYLELLGHDSEAVREEAVKALLDMLDTETVEALTEIVEQGDHSGMLEAIWLLGKSEETQSSETLLKLMHNPDPQVREVVAGAFAEIGDVRALQGLIDALEDENPGVRDAAALALGELRDSRAVLPLIDKLADESIQQVAAWALAMIGDRRAIDPLKTALFESEDPNMRGMAARALGKIAHADADAIVLESLKDEDEGVLIEAIRVIGERRYQPGVAVLERMFHTTPLERVRLACAVGLARCGHGDPYLDFLLHILSEDEDWGARLSAVMGLREMGFDKVESHLRKALQDEHWLVQKTAARSLLELEDAELYKALESSLGEEEEDIMQAVLENSFYELLGEGDDEDDD